MATIAELLKQCVRALQTGDSIQAEMLCGQILQAEPWNVDALAYLAAADIGQGRVEAGVERLKQVTAARPGWAEVRCNLGVALAMLGKQEEAVASYREALRLQPNYADAERNLGVALAELGQHDEAIAAFKRALQQRPGFAEAYANLGNLLRRKGRLDDAVAALQEAVRLKPAYAEGYSNLGNGYLKRGDFDLALKAYAQALDLRASYAQAHYNRSIARLLTGDLPGAWQEYEWRWQCKGFYMPPHHQPRWDGSPLQGRTLLLHAEQGLGDTLHFIRYAALAKARGGTVFFECQRPLLQLLARTPGIDRLLPMETQMPAFDVHSPLVSLPCIFGTNLTNIPAQVPYVFADENLLKSWRHELAGLPGFKIGIAWQGDPKHQEDQLRSIRLAAFEPLAKVAGVCLINLQKGPGAEQLDQVGFNVIDYGDRLDGTAGPFMDTAAVMKCLDLVITCDSAVAHLAGALAVPVWVPIHHVPDWRWLLDREDTPWYPTMRLFRQSAAREWGSVFARIAQELQKLVAVPRKAATIRVETAPGELIDKITILQIKSERMTDQAKLANVRIELATLTEARDQAVPMSPELDRLTADLKAANEALWEIEDNIRACERATDFGPRFIELARSVYRQNDRRAALKRAINELLGSKIIEEKSYAPY
jgi:tetratricopeptide (TPR) repeat protein